MGHKNHGDSQQGEELEAAVLGEHGLPERESAPGARDRRGRAACQPGGPWGSGGLGTTSRQPAEPRADGCLSLAPQGVLGCLHTQYRSRL